MSKRHYIIPIFVPHEGCPHNCVFCNQNRITGEVLREKREHKHIEINAEYTRNTIEEYLKTIDTDNATVEVSFFGGTFTAIPMEKQRELLSVAKEYKDRGNINYIRMSTRPDYIDDRILTHLKKYDADIIELGVQSLDDEVLVKSGRGHSCEDVVRASQLIKKYGFILGHQIMPGLPGDDFERDLITAEKSIAMHPDICRIYPSLVIKDTPMETMYLRGEYTPYSLDDAIEICKKIYIMYMVNDINVIRIGLQPTENINLNGDVIAGPFHPAIRELIESSILNDIISQELENSESEAELYINPRDISKLYADKKRFFKFEKNIKVFTSDDIKRGEFGVNTYSSYKKIDVAGYLKEHYKSYI